MKVFEKVRGTMEKVPQLEVNMDMVYYRNNITPIQEEDFTGWEYDEIQYNKDEFISKIGYLETSQVEQDELILELLTGGVL